MVIAKDVRKWYAEEVKERMEDAGLEPYRVAYLCRVKHENIYGYLQGKPFPRTWNLILLAECLDCSVNDLLGYDEIDDVEVYEKHLASKMYLDELDYASHFSRRLLRVMSEQSLLPEQIHDRTGIGLSALENWISERPEGLPSVLNLLRLSDALNCTPSDLLGY